METFLDVVTPFYCIDNDHTMQMVCGFDLECMPYWIVAQDISRRRQGFDFFEVRVLMKQVICDP